MIVAKCFGQEWISAKAEELRYPDKNVIERVVIGTKPMSYCSRCCVLKIKG